ncbi:unnamed protein product [Caenorhabditis auriculariae]|uniref:Uncharacterized protein n=1 Tax=Caenorhabditis auriculariae TaxID=2777116 RepID=A0A8S1HGZ7_9PELO|nr:unnamed protein product [Caenorhabditis auriculariae]
MRNILLFLLLVLFERVCLTELPEESIQIDNNTVFVLFGTRHGNRHPEVFLAENPRSWGFEGSTELTSFGKRQGYGLGKELRKFIGKLVSNNYNMSQVRYYSSSANRCQMTLQTTVAGIHPPEKLGRLEH